MDTIMGLAGDVLTAFRGLLRSRKVWTALIGAGATAWCDAHGCDPARVEELGQIVIALLIGQGAADWGKSRAPDAAPASQPVNLTIAPASPAKKAKKSSDEASE